MRGTEQPLPHRVGGMRARKYQPWQPLRHAPRKLQTPIQNPALFETSEPSPQPQHRALASVTVTSLLAYRSRARHMAPYRDVKEWTTFRELLDSNRGLVSTAATYGCDDERVLEVAIKIDPIGESEAQIGEVKMHAPPTPLEHPARHSCHRPSTAKTEPQRNSRHNGTARSSSGCRRLSPCTSPRVAARLSPSHQSVHMMLAMQT